MGNLALKVAALPTPSVEPCGCERWKGPGDRWMVERCAAHEREHRERERKKREAAALKHRIENAAALLVSAGFFPEHADACLDDFADVLPIAAHAWLDAGTEFGLLIKGPVGPGKTQLAAALAREIVIRGAKIEAIMAGDLIARLRASFSDKSTETEAEVVKHYRGVDVLVLDDLGFEGSVTQLVISALHRILSWRNGYRLRTIVTTNLKATELEQIYGRAIADRLAYWQHLVVDGPSRRKRD